MKTIGMILLLLLLSLPMTALAEYLPGEHVNDFTLPDSYGNDVSLYDYSDYIVVMAFWENG